MFLIEGWGSINCSPVDHNHFSFSNSITFMASTMNNPYPIRGKVRGERANGAGNPAVLQKRDKNLVL